MRRTAAFIAAVLAAADAHSQGAGPLPAWAIRPVPARFATEEPAKAFVSTGRSGQSGPSDLKNEQAEDDARQQMGQIIADWQEAALRCARRASETTVKASSKGGTGALLDFTFESATTVSFYRDKVTGRAYDGKRILVQLRHELVPMIRGVAADPDRSPGLKEAVASCGEKAFDELATKKR